MSAIGNGATVSDPEENSKRINNLIVVEIGSEPPPLALGLQPIHKSVDSIKVVLRQ
jgi:hypothetical protein